MPNISNDSSRTPLHQLTIRVANGISLTPEVEAVLRAMFAEFGQIVVEAEFGRGFSGSRAFRVRLFEPSGQAHLPAVVKIAAPHLIQSEWQAYQAWVKNTLSHIARLDMPPVEAEDSPLAGLQYSLVGGGTFAVQSLRDYYWQTGLDDLRWVLEERLFRIMGPQWWFDNRTDRAFQMQADYDILLPVNLLIRPLESPVEAAEALPIRVSHHQNAPACKIGDRVRLEGFVVTKADPKKQEVTLNVPAGPAASYRVRLIDVTGARRYAVGAHLEPVYGEVVATRDDILRQLAAGAFGKRLDLTVGTLSRLNQTGSSIQKLPNPLWRYQRLLQEFLTVKISIIHGDLNTENILIDPATREISLIDFATARQGHNLHDLLRLETEVLIMFIPAELDQAGLPPETIIPLYAQLHQASLYSHQTLRLPWPALEKSGQVLMLIRQMVRKCLFNPDDWGEYYRGLILYLLGALKFASLDDAPGAPLPKQVAFLGAAIAEYLLDNPFAAPELSPASQRTMPQTTRPPALAGIEPPFGTMHPDSYFYIERAADAHCRQQLATPYAATIFVQAPMQMGKSSLLRRVLHQARSSEQQQTAYIDFQKFPEQLLTDEENFFIQFCLMVGDAFDIPEAIDQFWAGRRTSIIKCSLYMSRHILPKLNGRLILAMDEIERMLTAPFRANFFGMLRTWHNNRVEDENFARLTLFLSSSTDPYLLIDNPHQSPFNVATRIPLDDFNLDEVRELNRRHHTPLNSGQIDELMNLLNGHPFLTRLALYQLALHKIDMPALLAQATANAGPFDDHLRHYFFRILANADLKEALTQICHSHNYPEGPVFHRLSEAGLIKKVGQRVVFRNHLYERYFKERLND